VSFGFLLIVVGAILTWAVNAQVSGVELSTVGVILMIAGVALVVLSLLFWSSFARTTNRFFDDF